MLISEKITIFQFSALKFIYSKGGVIFHLGLLTFGRMKSVLVLGKNGQLGKALIATEGTQGWRFLSRESADLSNPEDLKPILKAAHFDILINAAAYTAVDHAESEAEKAMLVNADSLLTISQICKEKGALLIHISTDYVFGNVPPSPICEDQETHPTSIYGKSKLQGERNIQANHPNHIIIRTSWLYGAEGHNFLKTMLRFGKERDELKVVFDQVGSPTYVSELAKAICDIVAMHTEKQITGIYHYSNEGVCSWYDFAKAIFDLSGMDTNVSPVLSDAFPSIAPRPAYSVLDKKKIKDTFGIRISHWRKALEDCLEELKLKNG